MTKIKKKDQGENLLNLAEGLRKSYVVTEIVKDFTEDFGEQIKLILKLVCLPVELLDEIQQCYKDKDLVMFILKNVTDAEKFLENRYYKEKVLIKYYKDKYPYLSELEFEGCELVSAVLLRYKGSELPNLPTCLHSLRLKRMYNLSLSGIESCENLRSLELVSMKNLTSLSGIEGCKNLHSLKLNTCWGLKNLSGIEACKNLQRLKISGCKNLQSLSGIEACKNLQSLYLYMCWGLTSLSDLKGCENLQSLKVGACSILTSLSGLEACVNLRMLEIASRCQENLDSESKDILKRLEENSEVEVVYF